MEEKIAPLILTQKVNKKYPNVWKQVEDITAVKDLPNYSSDAVNIKNYSYEIKL